MLLSAKKNSFWIYSSNVINFIYILLLLLLLLSSKACSKLRAFSCLVLLCRTAHYSHVNVFIRTRVNVLFLSSCCSFFSLKFRHTLSLFGVLSCSIYLFLLFSNSHSCFTVYVTMHWPCISFGDHIKLTFIFTVCMRYAVFFSVSLLFFVTNLFDMHIYFTCSCLFWRIYNFISTVFYSFISF